MYQCTNIPVYQSTSSPMYQCTNMPLSFIYSQNSLHFFKIMYKVYDKLLAYCGVSSIAAATLSSAQPGGVTPEGVASRRPPPPQAPGPRLPSPLLFLPPRPLLLGFRSSPPFCCTAASTKSASAEYPLSLMWTGSDGHKLSLIFFRPGTHCPD